MLRTIEAFARALVDPARRDRTVGLSLIALAAIYGLYAIISRSSRDIYFDIGEIVNWSRRPALAYHHPPMSPWIGQGWFTIFPRQDWSAYALAVAWIALTLWVYWRLYSEWLDDRKRVFALAMMTLVPLLTFHALFFNANSVQLPFWGLATLFFLRAFKTHRPLPSALAGAALGCAFLGKYWAVFLAAGLVAAALIDRRRWDYLKSSSPWISAAAALLVVAPHLIWLSVVDPVTVSFAQSTTYAEGLRLRSLIYFGEILGYAAVPLIAFFALRPTRAAVDDVVRPDEDDRRLIWAVFLVPLILPPLVNLFAPYRLTGLWSMPNWALLPLVLLGSERVTVSFTAVVRLLAVAVAVPLLALVASPGVAYVMHIQHKGASQPHYRALADTMQRIWRENTPKPLLLTGGDADIVNGAAFYLPSSVTLENHLLDEGRRQQHIKMSGEEGERVKRDGVLLACINHKPFCMTALREVEATAGGRWYEVPLTRRFFGLDGTTESYTFLVIPPAQ